MFKLDLEKAEEPESKLTTSAGSLKKQKSLRKTSTSALLTMPKPLTMWVTTNCRNFFKRWEYQTTWPASWAICMQVKKQQLEPDMEQQTEGKREWDDRGWDGWTASLTQWTWIWVNPRSWWWTGNPGVLLSMGSQRFGHDWVTELSWTELSFQAILP